jgi:hypothetical protein
MSPFNRSADIVAATGVISFSDTLNVQLSRIRVVVNNSLVDITSSWTASLCRTTAVAVRSAQNMSDLNAFPCFFGNNVTTATLPTVLNPLLVCLNVIDSVHYTITHASTSVAGIQSVTADVVVRDVSLSVSSSSSLTQSVTWSQSFAVDFVSVNAQDLNNVNGNLVQRQRSGNPGYIMGKPVLFAQFNGSTMKEFVDGLTIPTATTTGGCPTSFEEVVKTTTRFGFDSLSGCLLSLTRQQLKDFCCTGAAGSCVDNAQSSVLENSQFVQSSSGLAYFLNVSHG